MIKSMVDPISKKMPLSSQGMQNQRIGKLHQGSTTIFIREETLESILDYSNLDLRREIGGFLVGGYFLDSESDIHYVEINHFSPAVDAKSQAASLTFTHETWSQANEDIRRRFPDQRILGWHHTHPGLGLFLSEYDLFIHRNFFSQPWQIAMVVDPRQREFVFYQWHETELVDCGFICVSDSSDK